MNTPSNLILLSNVKKGHAFVVRNIEDKSVRTQLIRFGIAEGTTANCHERLPFGPIVVKHSRQELALGRELANHIWVELVA